MQINSRRLNKTFFVFMSLFMFFFAFMSLFLFFILGVLRYNLKNPDAEKCLNFMNAFKSYIFFIFEEDFLSGSFSKLLLMQNTV